MSEVTYDFSTKKEMLSKLRAYTETPDDDNIRIKEKIKNRLLRSPELLYALHNKELEGELFDSNGNLTPDGEWDRYFGKSSNIRPFLFFPEVQTEVSNYIGYKVDCDSEPKYNDSEKYCEITFVIFVNGDDSIDASTGISRHDLIASILREIFQKSNIFGLECTLTENKEGTTDTRFLTRTLVFQTTLPNNLVRTVNGRTGYINMYR